MEYQNAYQSNNNGKIFNISLYSNPNSGKDITYDANDNISSVTHTDSESQNIIKRNKVWNSNLKLKTLKPRDSNAMKNYSMVRNYEDSRRPRIKANYERSKKLSINQTH